MFCLCCFVLFICVAFLFCSTVAMYFSVIFDCVCVLYCLRRYFVLFICVDALFRSTVSMFCLILIICVDVLFCSMLLFSYVLLRQCFVSEEQRIGLHEWRR